jgi:hypothetical protein
MGEHTEWYKAIPEEVWSGKKSVQQPIQGAPIGFTGYGADGRNQPSNPTNIIQTAKGPLVLHEGEATYQQPDGTVKVMSQAELARIQQQNRLPGMAIGGTYSTGGAGGKLVQPNRTIVQPSTQPPTQNTTTPSGAHTGIGPIGVTPMPVQTTVDPTSPPPQTAMDPTGSHSGMGAISVTPMTQTVNSPVAAQGPAATDLSGSHQPIGGITVQPPAPAQPSQNEQYRAQGMDIFSQIAAGKSPLIASIQNRAIDQAGGAGAAATGALKQEAAQAGYSPEAIGSVMQVRARDVAGENSKLMGDLASQAQGAAIDAAGTLVTEGAAGMAVDFARDVQEFQTLLATPGNEEAAAAAFGRLFPGSNIDFGAIVRERGAERFGAAMESLTKGLTTFASFDDWKAAAVAEGIYDDLGMDDATARQTWDSVKTQSNPYYATAMMYEPIAGDMWPGQDFKKDVLPKLTTFISTGGLKVNKDGSVEFDQDKWDAVFGKVGTTPIIKNGLEVGYTDSDGTQHIYTEEDTSAFNTFKGSWSGGTAPTQAEWEAAGKPETAEKYNEYVNTKKFSDFGKTVTQGAAGGAPTMDMWRKAGMPTDYETRYRPWYESTGKYIDPAGTYQTKITANNGSLITSAGEPILSNATEYANMVTALKADPGFKSSGEGVADVIGDSLSSESLVATEAGSTNFGKGGLQAAQKIASWISSFAKSNTGRIVTINGKDYVVKGEVVSNRSRGLVLYDVAGQKSVTLYDEIDPTIGDPYTGRYGQGMLVRGETYDDARTRVTGINYSVPANSTWAQVFGSTDPTKWKVG